MLVTTDVLISDHYWSDWLSVLKMIPRLRMMLDTRLGLRLGLELTNMSLTLSQVPLLGWAGIPSSLVNS